MYPACYSQECPTLSERSSQCAGNHFLKGGSLVCRDEQLGSLNLATTSEILDDPIPCKGMGLEYGCKENKLSFAFYLTVHEF